MPDNDLRGMHLVAGIVSSEALKRAQRLLGLAESATTEDDSRALAGAAIIVAVAYLSQMVEFEPVQALAQALAEDAQHPSELEVRSQVPPGLPAQMRKLPTVLGGPGLQLDERQEATRRLLGAVNLRNRLVHDAGVHGIGPLVDFAHSIVDGIVWIRVDAPANPWKDLDVELARFVVEAAESYCDDLHRVVNDASATNSRFFCRVPDRSALGGGDVASDRR